jgi:hypothetical protein
MKRIKIMGLCLVAVCAFSAAAVASASAAEMPVFRVCKKAVPKETGKFNTKTCTGESKGGKKEGDYELGAWNEGKEKEPKTKGTNGASTLTSYIKGFGIVGAVTCSKAKSAGHITGSDTETVVVTFEKCTSSGEVCTSAGAPKSGDIVTKLLTGLLILISASPVEVGVNIAGSPTSAEFACGAEKISTTGSVDGVLTGNVGKFGKETTSTFAVNGGGENVVSNEEGGTPGESVLLTEVVGVGNFESGENTTSKTKGEEMLIEPK